MRVVNHKLEGIEYDAAQRIKGIINPIFIVMHYTAGYSLSSAVNTFKSSVIAAHLTIDRNGKTVQQVPFNRGCNHAGPSVYQGVEYLNNHAIGIEHVNIGWLKKSGGKYIDAYKGVWKGDPADLIAAKHPRVGGDTYYWPKYPEDQLAKSEEIVKALVTAYPSIRAIVSHEEIDTRGWKTDPGPAFPLDRYRKLLGGTFEDTPAKSDGRTVTVKDGVKLNIRTGPGASFAMASEWPMHPGQTATVLKQEGVWLYVEVNSYLKGWIHGGYVR